MIAWFETDLDVSLHFHHGLIVLTDCRLLHVEMSRTRDISLLSWPLNAIDDLVLEEMGATAAIHLIQGGVQTYEWRTTSGCVREADAFLARLKIVSPCCKMEHPWRNPQRRIATMKMC